MGTIRVTRPVLLVLGFALLVALSGEARRTARAESSSGADEILQIAVRTDSGKQVLVTVNTAARKIMVYKLESDNIGRLMIASWRDYKYDLVMDEWPTGRNTIQKTSKEMEDEIEKTEDFKKDKKEKKVKTADEWVGTRLKGSQGQTILTAINPMPGGTNTQPDLIYLQDKANKKILVYDFSGNTLRFLAARKVEYDERAIYSSRDPMAYTSYRDMKKAVEDEEERMKKEKEKQR